MLTNKEYYGAEFHAFRQQEHDKARVFLKNCGKPKDDIDMFLINMNRETVHIFSGAFSKEVRKKLELEGVKIKIQNKIESLKKQLELM